MKSNRCHSKRSISILSVTDPMFKKPCIGWLPLAALMYIIPIKGMGLKPEDVATIDGIIRAYYEVISGPAGESADIVRDRTLHHPDAWVAISETDKDGKPSVSVMGLAEFQGENKPRSRGFWERETSREVRRAGNMAQIWSH